MDPEDKIVKELTKLQEEKGIKIINARERGSRMTGVSHAESDYDVLFLFSQPAENYATIHGRIDSIHEPHLGEVDLHGWNIDKFGQLVRDSNPDAIAYCRENANEYITGPREFSELAEHARENFNHMALYHHYLSMGKRNWSKYIDSGNESTNNRQFHSIRPVAMAQHLRKSGSLPPFDVFELAQAGHLSDDVKGTLLELALQKRAGNNDEEINDIVGHLYKEESEIEMEPTDERINSLDDEIVDNFIRASLPR